MSKFKSAISLLILIIFFSGCQTVKKKTDAVIEKENKMLSEYIGQSATKLQMDLGKPDEDFENEKGNFVMIYNTKKYGSSNQQIEGYLKELGFHEMINIWPDKVYCR